MKRQDVPGHPPVYPLPSHVSPASTKLPERLHSLLPLLANQELLSAHLFLAISWKVAKGKPTPTNIQALLTHSPYNYRLHVCSSIYSTRSSRIRFFISLTYQLWCWLSCKFASLHGCLRDVLPVVFLFFSRTFQKVDSKHFLISYWSDIAVLNQSVPRITFEYSRITSPLVDMNSPNYVTGAPSGRNGTSV